MLKGFKEFILRGNVVDMAVGVVIGASFGTVVSGLVKDLLTPFIAALVKTVFVRGLYKRANCVSYRCGRHLFLCGAPSECDDGKNEEKRSSRRSRHQKMSAVPQRNSHRRKAVRLLHLGRGIGRFVASPIFVWPPASYSGLEPPP